LVEHEEKLCDPRKNAGVDQIPRQKKDAHKGQRLKFWSSCEASGKLRKRAPSRC